MIFKKLKILIITDFSPNENGFGGTQTASNFIQRLPGEQLIFIHEQHYREIQPDAYILDQNKIFLFRYVFSWYPKNRLEPMVKWWRDRINMRFFYLPKALKKKITDFKPTHFIFIANTPYIFRALIYFKKKYAQIPVFIYVMDDYRYYHNHLYQRYIRKAFQYIGGWFPISNQMQTQFEKAYEISSLKSVLVFQNPIAIGKMIRCVKPKPSLRLVYAGSIYPNHLQPLLLFVQAVNAYPAKIQLDIYTKPEFNHLLEGYLSNRVQIKGQILYRDLHQTLSNYTFGIVTESFDTVNHVAAASVQTKINDYILSGVLPVVIGPIDGACHQHVWQHQIGHVYNGMPCVEAMTEFIQVLEHRLFTFEQDIQKAQQYLTNTADTLTQQLEVILHDAKG